MMSHDEDTTPNEFICPISYEIMTDPVMIESGHIFERASIEQWFQNNNTCPKTRKIIQNKHLILPAHELRGRIISWKEDQERMAKATAQPATLSSEKKEKENDYLDLFTLKLEAHVKLLIIQISMAESLLSKIDIKEKDTLLKATNRFSKSILTFNRKVTLSSPVSAEQYKELSKEYADLGVTLSKLMNDILMNAHRLPQNKKQECWLLFDGSLNLHQEIRKINNIAELEPIFVIANNKKNAFVSSILSSNTPTPSLAKTATYSPALYSSTVTKSKGAYDYLLDIQLFGDKNCGKKSLISRFTDDAFSSITFSYTARDFATRSIELAELKIKLQIGSNKTYLKRFCNDRIWSCTDIFGIVFDLSQLTNADLEQLILKWIKLINNHSSKTPTIIFIGSKADLVRKEVTDEVFHLYAQQNNCLSAIVSAKTGKGVDEAFLCATRTHLVKTGILKIEQPEGEKELEAEITNKSSSCLLM